MAKQNPRGRTSSAPRKTAPRAAKKPLIPEKYQDAAWCGLLVLSIIVFFHEAIFSGSFLTSDNVASLSFEPFLNKASDKGEFPEWVPYIFSGFPGYPAQMITGDRWWDLLSNSFFSIPKIVGGLFNSDAARVSVFYMFYAIGMYILMRHWKQERFAAFFTSFAAVFATLVIAWIMIGHNTKPVMIMTFPYMLLCLEKLRERFSWLYAALLMVVTHVMFDPAYIHHQMAYYALMMIAIYFVYHLVGALRDRAQLKGWGRAVSMLALAGVLAFIMAGDRFLTNLEYLPYSTRGTAPLVNTLQSGGDHSEADEKGDYDYATSYSFDPPELRTWFVPNFYGFGRMTYEGPEVPQPTPLNTYWGSKPISDAALYWGIGVLFLAVFGAVWYWKEGRVKFLLIVCGISLLTSFGSHLPLLYDLLYYGLPGFKSFRAPETMLVLFSFGIAILSGHGIAGLIAAARDKELGKERSRHLLYGLGVAVVFLLLGVAYAGMFGESYMMDAREVLGARQYPEFITQFVYDNMISDWYQTAFLAIAFMLAAWLYVRRTITSAVFVPLMLLLLVVDLWRVDYRPMEVSEGRLRSGIQAGDVETFLMKDDDLFRIAEFRRQNQAAYFFLQNIHGYSSAKLRVYQDLMDMAGTPSRPGENPQLKSGVSFITNPFLWDLLNVKYIMFPQQLPGRQELFQSSSTGEFVYRNETMLPRAFFVDSVATAAPADILGHIREGNFDPRQVAFLEEDLPGGQTIEPARGATAEITKFGNHEIDVKVNATGNNLLFLSEIFYPVAWRAYIDGEEIPIHKTNFAFRSVVVPAGEHTIQFRYESNWEWIKTLALIVNILIMAGLAFGVYRTVNSRRTQEAV